MVFLPNIFLTFKRYLNVIGILTLTGFPLWNKNLIFVLFSVLNDPRVADLCDYQIFIELDRETCWDRRRHRTYDPEDQIGYFDAFMWPWYLKNLENLKSAGRPIFYLDGKDSIQENTCHILNHLFKNLNLK